MVSVNILSRFFFWSQRERGRSVPTPVSATCQVSAWTTSPPVRLRGSPLLSSPGRALKGLKFLLMMKGSERWNHIFSPLQNRILVFQPAPMQYRPSCSCRDVCGVSEPLPVKDDDTSSGLPPACYLALGLDSQQPLLSPALLTYSLHSIPISRFSISFEKCPYCTIYIYIYFCPHTYFCWMLYAGSNVEFFPSDLQVSSLTIALENFKQWINMLLLERKRKGKYNPTFSDILLVKQEILLTKALNWDQGPLGSLLSLATHFLHDLQSFIFPLCASVSHHPPCFIPLCSV